MFTDVYLNKVNYIQNMHTMPTQTFFSFLDSDSSQGVSIAHDFLLLDKHLGACINYMQINSISCAGCMRIIWVKDLKNEKIKPRLRYVLYDLASHNNTVRKFSSFLLRIGHYISLKTLVELIIINNRIGTKGAQHIAGILHETIVGHVSFLSSM